MPDEASLFVVVYLALSTLVVVSSSSLCPNATATTYDVAINATTGKALFVVGQSAPLSGPLSRTGNAVRAGIHTALASANGASALQFELSSLDDSNIDTKAGINIKTLLCKGANGFGPAFAIAGSVSSWISEVIQMYTLAGGGVVLSRVDVIDEINAIVTFLARDWDVLNRTTVLCQEELSGHAVAIAVNDSVRAMGATLLSSVLYPDPGPGSTVDQLKAIAKNVTDRLLRNGAPRAVILATLGQLTGLVIEEMARRGVAGVQYVGTTWYLGEDLYRAVPKATWTKLSRELSSSVYFTQLVPMPTDQQLVVAREYRRAMGKYHPELNYSHASFEGFISGRLITMAAFRALELHGWPITRAGFLDVIFREVRTFDVYGYRLGPYGDGIGSEYGAQTEDDWCNQGAHEVFMTRMSLDTGELAEETSSSFKFQGCSSWGRTKLSTRTVVGFVSEPGPAKSAAAQKLESTLKIGMGAAASSYNSKAGNRLITVTSLVSDLAGALRVPFARSIVNLFASNYQEAKTAVMFLAKAKGARTVVLLYNRTSHGAVASDFSKAIEWTVNALKGENMTWVAQKTAPYSSDIGEAQAAVAEATGNHSFIVLASTEETETLLRMVSAQCAGCPAVITSAVGEDEMWFRMMSSNATWGNVYRTSVTPPLSMFGANHPLRLEFENWVSSSSTLQSTFEGFLMGKFLTAVMSSIDDELVDQVDSRAVLNTIYGKKYFRVDNKIAFGPFLDDTSGERACNQGMDTVYVTRWAGAEFSHVPFTAANESVRCGREFDPPEASEHSGSPLVLAISIGVPGAAVALLAVGAAIAVGTRTRSTLKKMRRNDVEIGELIGKGQQGTVHNGDWHGTPVAIRVVDKAAVTKEELKGLREEMELTHSLHHPNLLMLLGYCESSKDLLVVYEYTANGSLHEYLKKNKQNMNFFNQVAIAFDVVKGLAFLHSSKPPVVHGNLSTSSLMIDGSLVTKICDFWCSRGKNSSATSSAKRQGWQAPEILEGHPATTSSDVFAFGIVLWELFIPSDMYSTLTSSSKSSQSQSNSVSGQAADPQTPPSSQQGTCPDIPPTTPKEVVALLNHCWQREPERRPSVFQILRNWPETFAVRSTAALRCAVL
eukprot:m51a1_g4450 putative serine threonine-protein kinase ctr1-like (1114) ;mRNA; r:150922-154987